MLKLTTDRHEARVASLRQLSFLFVWSQRLAERLAETELRTERSLNPIIINSPVNFACTR